MVGFPCPFCAPDGAPEDWSHPLAFATRDQYPVSPGHTLLITRRHVVHYFDATPNEQAALWQGVAAVKDALDRELSPDGYNVGFNAGTAAGQTVPHLHVHVIPRFTGDVDDPRGGVRGAIPSKQRWSDDDAPVPFADLPHSVLGQDERLLGALTAALAQADSAWLLAAFIQRSGLALLENHLVDALSRGAQVRVLAGDYLNITHPHALQRLLTLQTTHRGLDARLYRVGDQPSFHPKAYLFTAGDAGVAYVGSSNLSATALTAGIEWNLRTRTHDADTFDRLRARFERLFDHPSAERLTPGLVKEYAAHTPVAPAPEPADPIPTPHAIQREVLDALDAARADGADKGLAVMATGLGKTFLSAFDFGASGGKRALFVAHRQEILEQAAATWSRVHPDRTVGLLVGDRREPDEDLLFASVQTLSRLATLREFDKDRFDYVVIDEFHHAAALTYRRLLSHFEPRFLLGLTATPDRLDGADLLHLCGDRVVARIGLVEGIARKQLAPFAYYGVRDSIDYSTIPWRNRRFDPETLTRAASTQARADQAVAAYRKHALPEGRKTLVFCCTRAHADFMGGFLITAGIPAAAVHSGPTSAPRAASLEALRDGRLEAICAVDIFNEGVDLPDVNTILMLRPTESPVIFLQQLGRGLRRAADPDKRLVVVDFIGNHRSFLTKTQALLSLTGRDAPPGGSIAALRAGLDLPEGCEVVIETGVLDMLEQVARLSKQDRLVYTYVTLRDTLGRRPTAGEVFTAGVRLTPIKQRYRSWFDFVAAQEDLDENEAAVHERHSAWFGDLLRTAMSASYKMVALRVLDDLDALHGEIDVHTLALRCRDALRHDLVLRAELKEEDRRGGDAADFVSRWREMPLRVFHNAKSFTRRWFELDGTVFRSQIGVAEEDRAVFDAMTSELVVLRLLEYKDRNRFADNLLQFAAPIALQVRHVRRSPALVFDRARRPDIPEGEAEVLLGGDPWMLAFGQRDARTARSLGGGPNALPRLLRTWFGPSAGLPGTDHRVELLQADGRWTLRPRRAAGDPADVVPIGGVPFFESLQVACGFEHVQFEDTDVTSWLRPDAEHPLDRKRHFVVRASGDSMDGGKTPIRDGDLVLCEWATVTDPREVEGRACLLAGGDAEGSFALLKVPQKGPGGWLLESRNPAHSPRPVPPGATLKVVGKVLGVVDEASGPMLWGLYDRDAIAKAFGCAVGSLKRVGVADIVSDGKPHTIIMLALRKRDDTPLEQRYADRFESPAALRWESQQSTTPQSLKGRRLLNHQAEGRAVHLFVRYRQKTKKQTAEPFVYCGTLQLERHEGSTPIRAWWRLDDRLPEGLWALWGSV